MFTDPDGQPLRLNAGRAGKSGRRQVRFADWDGDGRLDLLVDSRNVNLLRNVSSPEHPWAFQDAGHSTIASWPATTRAPPSSTGIATADPDLLIGAEDGHFYYRPHE